MSDYERFKAALSQVVGERLTYQALIGKEAQTTSTEEAFQAARRERGSAEIRTSGIRRTPVRSSLAPLVHRFIRHLL
jgi:hypothetical protein